MADIAPKTTTAAKAPAAPKKAPVKRAPAKPKAPVVEKKRAATLSAEDLYLDGQPHPLMVQTANLQASVKADLGRVLISISIPGWVGEDAVVLLGSCADEIRELADLLDAEAAKR